MEMPTLIAEQLAGLKTFGAPLTVSLSNDLVRLLSDQLYQSPLKAVEELVVNAYDADANLCRVFVPTPSDFENDFIIVFDNGAGMDYNGLVDLWHIGGSKKRIDEIEKKLKRKQIGKFGIGKLAASTIAHKLTYITRHSGKILTVSIDFRDFSDQSPEGGSPASSSVEIKRITAKVHEIDNWQSLITNPRLAKMIQVSQINQNEIKSSGNKSWTLAILEDLTDKAHKIKTETLRWILSTAMPLRADFILTLNGEQIISSKEKYDKWVEFTVSQLPDERLRALKESTGENWQVKGESLISESFPSGVKGNVFVTKPTLPGGKSDDIIRSHGFFIRVRERLINDNDPLFGMKPLFFGTFVRFHADIDADDLDEDLKASRETIEETAIKGKFRLLLREIFNHANTLYDNKLQEEEEKKKPKEGERNQVPPRLVEYPVADFLVENPVLPIGAEADESWFYLSIDPKKKIDELIKALYTPQRKKYKYQYENNGKAGRLVKFDPESSIFWINQEHELAQEYIADERSRDLLEDFVTAEALLEIYLRENRVPVNIVGKILEQRDELLRSLARDRSYSFETISIRLSDATSDEHELETHVGGTGKPDGLAILNNYPEGAKKITLEAKSSEGTPSLSAIDFAGLQEHVKNENADGCLLIAPCYPGDSQSEYAASRRAQNLQISCWTIEQLAQFVRLAEKRQFNANHILQIVLNAYTQEEVTAQINDLLAKPKWDQRSLYLAILRSLRQLDGRLPDKPRTLDMVATEVSRESEFSGIDIKSIESAIVDLEGASQGGMTFRNNSDNIVLHVSVAELERRLTILTKQSSEPRRQSSFRKDE
jgi:hypothetical protein